MPACVELIILLNYYKLSRCCPCLVNSFFTELEFNMPLYFANLQYYWSILRAAVCDVQFVTFFGLFVGDIYREISVRTSSQVHCNSQTQH